MPNVPFEILEKQPFSKDSIAILLLVAARGKTVSKKSAAALKDELSPKPRKKLPNVASEVLEKQPLSQDSVACGCSQENSVEKSSSRQENTMALKDELVPKPRQKSA